MFDQGSDKCSPSKRELLRFVPLNAHRSSSATKRRFSAYLRVRNDLFAIAVRKSPPRAPFFAKPARSRFLTKRVTFRAPRRISEGDCQGRVRLFAFWACVRKECDVGTMFWKVTGFSMTSPIDTILEKSQFTLEELLKEDDLIQECRSLNGRLINFLASKENVEAMLQHMLHLPSSPHHPEKQVTVEAVKRLSWQSCEVFCCEVDPIFSILLENEDTMRLFLSIVDSKEAIDATTAGYFGRVMNHLLLRRPVQITHFLTEHRQYIVKFIDHLEDTSIADVTVKLLGADEQTNTQLPTNYIHWISQTDALQRVIARLNASETMSVQRNAAHVLIAIIRSQPSPLARELASGENLQHLLQHVMSDDGEVSVPILNVIISSLDPRKRPLNGLRSLSATASYDDIVESNLFQQLSQKLTALLPRLGQKLRQSPQGERQNTPYGALVPPLGPARLKIIEVFAILMNTRSEAVMQGLMVSQTMESCMELFMSYPFHNLLHQNVLSILTNALAFEYQPLLELLFQKLKLSQWITQLPLTITSTKTTLYSPRKSPLLENGCSSEEETLEKTQEALRVGYMGHVILLSNQIIQAAKTNTYIAAQLRSDSSWQTHVSTVVLPINLKEDLSSWECGRPPELALKDTVDDHGDITLPSSSNGTCYKGNFGNSSHGISPLCLLGCAEDDDEEDEDEEGDEAGESIGLQWRPDVLTSEEGEVSGTVAMFSRMGLQEPKSIAQKEMSDSTSSSSNSTSSSSNSSSGASSTSSEEDGAEGEERLIMVSPQALLESLSKEHSTSIESSSFLEPMVLIEDGWLCR